MGLTWWQILLIVGVVVLLFGAKRLPKLAKSIGESMKEFRKGVNTAGEDKDDSDESLKDPTAQAKAELDQSIDKEPSSIADLEKQIRNNPDLNEAQKEAMIANLRK